LRVYFQTRPKASFWVKIGGRKNIFIIEDRIFANWLHHQSCDDWDRRFVFVVIVRGIINTAAPLALQNTGALPRYIATSTQPRGVFGKSTTGAFSLPWWRSIAASWGQIT
jgi:hypothetical protein